MVLDRKMIKLFPSSNFQVFTCGDNSSFCCGHKDTNRPIFRPRLVESLKGIPCKQVKTEYQLLCFYYFYSVLF